MSSQRITLTRATLAWIAIVNLTGWTWTVLSCH